MLEIKTEQGSGAERRQVQTLENLGSHPGSALDTVASNTFLSLA